MDIVNVLSRTRPLPWTRADWAWPVFYRPTYYTALGLYLHIPDCKSCCSSSSYVFVNNHLPASL